MVMQTPRKLVQIGTVSRIPVTKGTEESCRGWWRQLGRTFFFPQCLFSQSQDSILWDLRDPPQRWSGLERAKQEGLKESWTIEAYRSLSPDPPLTLRLCYPLLVCASPGLHLPQYLLSNQPRNSVVQDKKENSKLEPVFSSAVQMPQEGREG